MIGWRDGDGVLHRGSLFATFAALARGEAWSFPALRSHQREPWHAFTVQVAALAMIHAGRDDLPSDEAGWRDLLWALTPDQPEAWELVVEDWSKPALLQPPVGSNDVAKYEAAFGDLEKVLRTPDLLDMLVTGRNHDVKRERMIASDDEHWLFALVTLQTAEGQMGRGNYGISRMKGGYSTRTSVGVRPGRGASAAFTRDVQCLVSDARGKPDYHTGIPLVWTQRWDGEAQIAVPDLDELYVEICRRVRLRRQGDRIVGMSVGSERARIAVKGQRGYRPDPWAPTRADGESISPPPSARFGYLGYRQMAKYFDRGETKLPLLAGLHGADQSSDLSIVATSLVRGEGGTEGLRRRAVRTSRTEKLEAYGSHHVFDQVGNVVSVRAHEASEASKRLRSALIMLVSGGEPRDDLVRGFDEDVQPWTTAVQSFERQVDQAFFDHDFWSEVAGDAEGHRGKWRERLRTLASKVFDHAAKVAPRKESRRLRAVARARSMLDAKMSKWLTEVAHER